MADSLFVEMTQAVEQAVTENAPHTEGLLSPVRDMLLYSLESGGKRVRPLLTLLFCRAAGGDWKNALPFACAVEYVHTYSLIHDDLPCMDDDDERRGRPSCHVAFGEALALLAGDGLLTKAFSVASEGGSAKAVRVISDCAYEMALGQADEFVNKDADLSVDNILEIYARKTGALLVAAAVCGGVAAGAEGETLDKLRDFALNLGLAFQLRDDLLDAEGEQSLLIAAAGRAAAEKLAAEYTQKAEDALACFGNNDFLMTLTDKLLHRNR
jgi:geranylgeranyl diphosphate synthase type II